MLKYLLIIIILKILSLTLKYIIQIIQNYYYK